MQSPPTPAAASRAKGLILSYHRIAPRTLDPWGLRVPEPVFARQMAMLRRFGEPLPLHDLAASRGGCNGRPAVAVTFDDGYHDNLALAAPHLEAHRIPATVFVASGYTGRRHFWWEVIEQVFLSLGTLPPVLSFRHGVHRFSWEIGAAATYSEAQFATDSRGYRWGGEPGSRIRLYFDVNTALWSLPVEARMDLAEDIRIWAGPAAPDLDAARPMTAAEIQQLASHELITIGGHSVNHPALDTLAPCAQRAEVVRNRDFLQDLTGSVVDTFAFPHGRTSPDSLAALRQQGFVAACTTVESAVLDGCDPLLLPRIVVRDWEAPEFAARLNAWFTA